MKPVIVLRFSQLKQFEESAKTKLIFSMLSNCLQLEKLTEDKVNPSKSKEVGIIASTPNLNDFNPELFALNIFSLLYFTKTSFSSTYLPKVILFKKFREAYV